jgi:hypothetical protein
MSKLGTQSEIDKLAGTLGLDSGQLEFLVLVSPEELRNFRIAIYERLFELDRVLFERLAMLATRMPPRVTARLAVRLGPKLAARVVAELPAGQALAAIAHVSDEFFAEAVRYLDPRRAHEVIVRVPVDRAVEVAKLLVGRGDFMSISRFVNYVTDEQTQAVVDAIDDEGAILRVAFYMGSKNRMDHLFRTLRRERIERLIQRVEQERDELLPAFLSVLIHVSYALKRELGDILAAQPQSVLEGYVRATHEQSQWPDVLPVVAGFSESARRTVVNLPILREREVQAALIESADGHGLWGLVLPLVAMMDDSNRDAVAAIIAAAQKTTLERASDAALMGEHWEILLDLAVRMPESKRAELADAVRSLLHDSDPELLDRLARRGRELGLDHLATSVSRTGASASTAYS